MIQFGRRSAPGHRSGRLVESSQTGVHEELLVVDLLLEQELQSLARGGQLGFELLQPLPRGHPAKHRLVYLVDALHQAGDQRLDHGLDLPLIPFPALRLRDQRDPTVQFPLLSADFDHHLVEHFRTRGRQKTRRRPHQFGALLRDFECRHQCGHVRFRHLALLRVHDAHQDQCKHDGANGQHDPASQPHHHLAADAEAAPARLADPVAEAAGQSLQYPLECGMHPMVERLHPGGTHRPRPLTETNLPSRITVRKTASDPWLSRGPYSTVKPSRSIGPASSRRLRKASRVGGP